MSEHSKLPWQTTFHGTVHDAGGVCILTPTRMILDTEAFQNSDFLVKVINSHAALVSALEGLLSDYKAFHAQQNIPTPFGEFNSAIYAAQNALIAAK